MHLLYMRMCVYIYVHAHVHSSFKTTTGLVIDRRDRDPEFLLCYGSRDFLFTNLRSLLARDLVVEFSAASDQDIEIKTLL